MSAASEVRGASYTYEESSKTPVVTIRSPMAQFPLGQIEEVGNEVLTRIDSLRPKQLLVDLSELDYMGSALVALVVRLWKSVKNERGHRMVVSVDSDSVREVLELARLTDHWTVVGSRAEGMKVLGLRTGGAVASSPSNDEASPVLPVVSVIGLVGALCGAVLVMVDSPLVTPYVGLGIAVVCAVVGLVCGTLMILGDSFARKVFGGVALAVCGLSVILALATFPAPQG